MQLELSARTSKVFSKMSSVVTVANNLITSLPLGVGKGTDVSQLVLRDSRYRHRTAATGTGQPLPAQDSRYRHRTAATGTGQPLPAQDVYNDGEGAFVDV